MKFENLEKYYDIIKMMYENPEIGNEEYKSSLLLVNLLKENSFEIVYPFVLPTGFKAVYKSKKKGSKIALLCEYDALEGIGHGCGHNMIGVLSAACAINLKDVVDQTGGEIVVLGTPAEENFGGKVTFVKEGVFDDCDAALMMHPSSKYSLGGKTSALNPVKFDFYGSSAHGCNPYEGASALDAAVLTYNSISMLRQYLKPNSYVHGIIKDGGTAANVVPGYASMEYYFRGQTMAYAQEITNKAIKCAKAAALATNTKLEYSVYEMPYDDTIVNDTLAALLKEKFVLVGVKEDVKLKDSPQGSSDIGSVSYICPILHGYFKISDENILSHSKEFANATISDEGKEGFLTTLEALYLVCKDLFTNDEILIKAKEELKNKLKEIKI